MYKHCDLEDAKIKYEVNEIKDLFEIKIWTDYPAFFVSFDTEGIKGRFSQNMFNLLPNEIKIITFNPKEKISINDFKNSLTLYDLRHTY